MRILALLFLLLMPPVTTYNYVLKAQDSKGNPLTAMTFAYTVGGAAPAAQTFRLFDTSPCPPMSGVPYCAWPNTTVTSDSSWLMVSPASGTTAFTVTVTVNPASLNTTQTGHVIATQPLFSTPTLSIPVTVTVTGAAHSVSLTWTAGAVDATHPAATSYNILKSTGFPGTFAQFATSTSTSFKDSTVSAGQNVCYQVEAVAGGNSSAPALPTICFTVP